MGARVIADTPLELHEARWWETLPTGKLHCYLCPRHCHIGEGQTGFCFIRKNIGGKLYNLGYAQPAAIQIDPIEKKPLNHFMPGTRIFSMGTAGCNTSCFFCQNWDISKSKADQTRSVHLEPAEVVLSAIEYRCPSLAFTYNEPTIWGEYVMDISKVAHEVGLKTVMVTNGWFEITNLMIPTLNDAVEETKELCGWILENLGDDVPLHFTAFHPDFKLRDKPNTPPETLHRARAVAMEMGLKFVYEGNIYSDGGNTICPGCKRTLVKRWWHQVSDVRITEEGECQYCGAQIPGYFKKPVLPSMDEAIRLAGGVRV